MVLADHGDLRSKLPCSRRGLLMLLPLYGNYLRIGQYAILELKLPLRIVEYVAPESKKFFLGEPKGFLFISNSTFSVPFNSVHQVVNTNDDEDCYLYKDWNTPHDDAISANMPWDKLEETASTKDEL